MRPGKKTYSMAAVAAVALSLSACGGASSYTFQNTTVTSKASGYINLTTYDPSVTPFDYLPDGAAQTVPGGSTGKARISLSASYAGGNWNVSGKYSDGSVQFTFKGAALEIVQGGLTGLRTRSGLNDGPQPNTAISGGFCVPVVTHYTSTNPAAPGTGYAMFAVCDNPGALGPMSSSIGWNSPDYVKVFIPASSTGDLNPYAQYLSGGYMTSPYYGVANTIAVPPTGPSATPTPTFPCPSGTSTATGGSYYSCPTSSSTAT